MSFNRSRVRSLKGSFSRSIRSFTTSLKEPCKELKDEPYLSMRARKYKPWSLRGSHCGFRLTASRP